MALVVKICSVKCLKLATFFKVTARYWKWKVSPLTLRKKSAIVIKHCFFVCNLEFFFFFCKSKIQMSLNKTFSTGDLQEFLLSPMRLSVYL